MSYYFHDIPGRLRLRTPAIKRNEEKATEIQEMLASMDGVRSTEVNTLTGSLVIHYDADAVSPKAITRTLTRAGYFDPARAISNDQYIHEAATKALTLLAAFI